MRGFWSRSTNFFVLRLKLGLHSLGPKKNFEKSNTVPEKIESKVSETPAFFQNI